MSRVVIAGDVGGTHTRLAVFDLDASEFRPRHSADFASPEISDFGEVLGKFAGTVGEPIAAAVIGAAGPLLGQSIKITNLSWAIDAARCSEALGGAPVRVLNDLEAMAYGILRLTPDDLITINQGIGREGNRVLIAAGTGLGHAILFWNGAAHIPSGSEAGHADFGPRTSLEVRLVEFLMKQFPRATWERALSGPGLYNLFRFVVEELAIAPSAQVLSEIEGGADPGAVVGRAAMAGSCAACDKAVEMFVSIYGAQAGNFALSVLGLGGVYVGGGVAQHLQARFTDGVFLEAFRAKQPFVKLVSDIPVHLITNPQVNLLGAAHVAAQLLAS